MMPSDHRTLWRSCRDPRRPLLACVCVVQLGSSTGWIHRVSRLRLGTCSSAWEVSVCPFPRVQDDFSSWGGRSGNGCPRMGGEGSLPQFPSSSSLRPSSLFPGQVTRMQLNEESCSYNAGSPRQSSSRLSGGDFGQLLSTRLIVSPQQIFPQRCYKTSIWQTPADRQALLCAGKEAGGTTDGYSKSELTIKISLEIAAK